MSKSVFPQRECCCSWSFFLCRRHWFCERKCQLIREIQRKQEKSINHNLQNIFWGRFLCPVLHIVGVLQIMVYYFLLGIVLSTGSLPWKLSRTCDVTKFSFFFFEPSLAEESPQHLGGIGWGLYMQFFFNFLKRETCWTNSFPFHGLVTIGGEQWN